MGLLTDASFLNLNLYQIVVDIFMPLQNFAQNPFGFVFIMFLYCFLYSVGISTSVLTPVASPIMIAAASANAEAAAAGMATNARHLYRCDRIFRISVDRRYRLYDAARDSDAHDGKIAENESTWKSGLVPGCFQYQ